MSGHRIPRKRTSRHLGLALVAVLTALLIASPGGATPAAQSAPSRAASGSVKAWCALVIQINTKYGTMKNKRYLPSGQVPLSAWKAVVNAAVAQRSRYLAVTPSSIKTAVRHQLTWFARVKANNYSIATPLAPLTIADVKQLANFQRTKCGIRFST